MTESRTQTRNSAGPTRTQAPPAASLPAIVGSVSNVQTLNQRLETANANFHLIAPQTAAPSLPEGCDVVISAVVVDPADTYPIPGSSARGLSKQALNKIASAAGISWDPVLSRRLDDGSDPRYCHYRAVGHVRNFDGTSRSIAAEKEIDTREGSPFVLATIEKSANKAKTEAAKSGKTISDAEAMAIGRQASQNQIRELRLHILSHAETKARLRAVRSLGVRTSYTEAELKKPFVVASLAFTGRTQDPALRREFALNMQKAMFGANTALYGSEARLETHHHNTPRHAPPPVASRAEPLDDDFDDDAIDVDPEPRRDAPPAPRQQAAAPAQGAPSQPVQGQAPAPVSYSGLTVPGGQEKGLPIEEASDKTLDYWANRIADSLDNGNSKYPDKDQKWLTAAQAEMARRNGGVNAGNGQGDEEVPF